MDPWNMWCAKPGSWEEGKLHDMGMRTPRECLQILYEAKKADVEMFRQICGKRALQESQDDYI
jgi:hypothetical protein